VPLSKVPFFRRRGQGIFRDPLPELLYNETRTRELTLGTMPEYFGHSGRGGLGNHHRTAIRESKRFFFKGI
jgi:hypothetical protein